MRFSIAILTIALLVQASAAAAFQGGIRGSVRYDYVDYRGEGDGQPDDEATSFSQQYSLLYSGGALLSGGRIGRYRFALGAEYTAFANSINGSDNSVDTFKPLYSGELLIAPGGLPFRLQLFSNDLRKTGFRSNAGINSELLRPSVVTDVHNGTYRTSGATLLLGIKNGSYLGSYRDTLSKFPRLLVDYRETEVESDKGGVDAHYILRDLAFVSLNKKDNWFHYRVRQYRNYLEPNGDDDTQTSSYILGTIDPTLNRAWINLTNWIKISADGSLVQERSGSVDQPKQTDTYALNLFAKARRAGGSASTYSSYSRSRELGELDQSISIPLYFNRKLSRDVAYSGEAFYRGRSDKDAAGGVLRERENAYVGVRVETRRTRRYILAPEAAVEVADDVDSQGSAVRTGIELSSNSRYASSTDFRLRLVLSSFQGENAGTSINYQEQELSGRVVRRVGRQWRLGGQERLLFGNGDLAGTATIRIRPATTLSQMNSSSRNLNQSGSVFRSLTSLYVVENTKKYSNRLQFDADYLQDDSNNNLQLQLTHAYEYGRGRVLTYSMENKLSQGDDQTRLQGELGGGELQGDVGVNTDLVYRHDSQLNYLPNRLFSAYLGGGLLARSGGSDSNQIFAKEGVSYNLYQTNGVLRRLAEFNQGFTYELVSRDDRQVTYYALSAAARYYPNSFLLFYASGKYEIRPEEERDLLTARLGTQLNFPKFVVSIDYQNKERIGDGTPGNTNRKEQQLQASLQKTF